jgi:hypothetical protein
MERVPICHEAKPRDLQYRLKYGRKTPSTAKYAK